MARTELYANRREVEKKAAKRLREEGIVPCILYGHGVGNIPLQIDAITLNRALNQAGTSQLIQLYIDEASSPQPVLAREIQRHLFTSEPIHVDFLAVSMTEKISAELSIILEGEPHPVAQGEGILLQGVNTIEIECLPGDLIASLEVDVSHLDFDTAMFVSDLELPSDITILTDPEEMVAQVVYEELEEEEEEEEEEIIFGEEMPEVEVIGKGKAAEEEEFEEEE